MTANKSFSTETSERYARALFEVSIETNDLEKTEKNIIDKRIKELADQNKTFEDKKEIFNACKFFIENKSITGQSIAIDSGQSLNWQTKDLININE